MNVSERSRHNVEVMFEESTEDSKGFRHRNLGKRNLDLLQSDSRRV